MTGRLLALLVGSLAGTSARAEPPAMKERQQRPRLEVVSRDGRYSVGVGGFMQAIHRGRHRGAR